MSSRAGHCLPIAWRKINPRTPVWLVKVSHTRLLSRPQVQSNLQPDRRCAVGPGGLDRLIVWRAKASLSRRIIRPLVVGI
jgi:hypothetical protein